MLYYYSNFYKKFLNNFVKKGKKNMIEYLYFKFFYEFNKFFLECSYAINDKTAASFKNSTVSFLEFFKTKSHVRARFSRTKVKINNLYLRKHVRMLAADKVKNGKNILKLYSKISLRKLVKIKTKKQTTTHKISFYKLFLYYKNFTKKITSFLLPSFVIYEIIYKLMPILSVRMVSTGSKGSSAKRKQQKLIGIPIVLNDKSRFVSAFKLFKDGFREKKDNNKEIELMGSFKNLFLSEIATFILTDGYQLYALKKKNELYSKVVQYKNNSSFK